MKKQKQRNSLIEEIEAVRHLKEILKKVKADPPNFELRIKDGSYTVIKYYDDQDAGNPETSAHSDGGPRRAKQKIRTVKSESPVFKLKNLLVNCVNGNLIKRKEEVVIMDQVNVAFEPGKMYLVL